MTTPFIQGIGLANPPRRFSQDDTFQMAGYTSPRILEIFRNCDIDYRHLYVEPGQGALWRGTRAVERPSERISCQQLAAFFARG